MLTRTDDLIIGQDATVAYVQHEDVSVDLKNDAGTYLVIEPKDKDADITFIFYPGGLVRPQAYEWLGVALAPIGVKTLIPEFPFDLAVTAPNRAQKLLEQNPSEIVVVGGHSLGGAMAARFLERNPNSAQGLVLMGAFSAQSDDLSALNLKTLVLAAEFDGLATMTEVREGLKRLSSPQLVEIPGAVHSFFGRYGPQKGDGIPTVTRGQAEDDIATALRAYFEQLR